MKKLPKSINPTPIVSASIEIRFNINCPYDAVFGMLYSVLSNEYEKYEELPIVNIPEQIRVQDNLLETPHYRFYNDDSPFSLLIAPKLFVYVYSKQSLNDDTNDYPGWSEFIYKELIKLYESIFKIGFIQDVYKLGIRYNDFFKDINIFDHTTFNLVDINNKRKDTISTQITQTIQIDNTINNISISNNALFQDKFGRYKGSVIDIDTFMINFDKKFKNNYKEYLQKCHMVNKELFYKNLKDEFVDSLNPVYEDKL